MHQLSQELVDIISGWKTWVWPYCSLPDNDDALVRVPTYLTDAMCLSGDKYDDVYTEVLAQEYKDALFRQGHVGCYITLLTALGDCNYQLFIPERNYLIRLQFEYITNHIGIFSQWKDAAWFESLINGTHGYNSLVPLMTFWRRIAPTEKEFRLYQYIVPIYLLLGSHLIAPKRLGILRAIYQSLVVSTCHVGYNNYQDVEADLSASRFTFRNIVEETNSVFHMPSKQVNINGFPVLLKYARKRDDNTAMICQAGDWLSFGAYITLVSKYARYCLPIATTKSIFSRELTWGFGIMQSHLFPYNQEGNPNGRNQGNGKELEP